MYGTAYIENLWQGHGQSHGVQKVVSPVLFLIQFRTSVTLKRWRFFFFANVLIEISHFFMPGVYDRVFRFSGAVLAVRDDPDGVEATADGVLGHQSTCLITITKKKKYRSGFKGVLKL